MSSDALHPGMRKLAVIACVLVVSAQAGATPAIYEEVPIRSISWSDFDSSGDSSSLELYATGYVRAQGKQRLAAGWYRVRDMKALQVVFDSAALAAAYPVTNKVANTVTLVSGAQINANVRLPDLPYESAAPPPPNTKAIVAGRRIASVPVRDALYYRDAARAGRLGREDAATFVVAVDLAQDRAFLTASFTAIGANHIDLLPPLLADKTAAPIVIAALAANGAKARPHVRAIVAATRSSFQALEAAGPALAAIGGDEAEAAVRDTIIPALSDPKLGIAYEVQALAVLDKLGRSEVVAQRLVAHAKDAIGKPLQAERVAEIGSIGGALAARKLLSIDLAVLVEGYLVKAMSSGDADVRLHAVIGVQRIYGAAELPPRIRTAIEPLAKDRAERIAILAKTLLEPHR
jgi:hypothetical protein